MDELIMRQIAREEVESSRPGCFVTWFNNLMVWVLIWYVGTELNARFSGIERHLGVPATHWVPPWERTTNNDGRSRAGGSRAEGEAPPKEDVGAKEES